MYLLLRVEFKRGKEKDLPKEGNLGTLFFAYDTGKVFEGNGHGKSLTKYSSILNEYENIADLEFKNPQIQGKLYITNDGGLYIYNGTNYISVGGGVSGYPPDIYEKSWNNQFNDSLIKILDIKELFVSENMRSISSSEILINNPLLDSEAGDNDVELVIKDRNIIVLKTKIKPRETQKYLLGIGTNTKVFVKGVFTGQLYINYYKKESN